ncbi:hypothetical protein VDG1235_2740 [Verrucomicrobiia bacterium DG1235]|nr:hypothetical protein VDG1235_2740 [Verrucomicrobiae bacterium DG1235]
MVGRKSNLRVWRGYGKSGKRASSRVRKLLSSKEIRNFEKKALRGIVGFLGSAALAYAAFV